MLYNPGFKAYEAGVEAAWLAQQYLGTPESSQKKQKNSTNMAPIRRPFKRNMYSKNSSKYGKSTPKDKIKKTILSMSSTFHSAIIDGTVGNTALAKNAIYNFPLTAQVIQGTAVGNRTGDSIYLAAFKFKGHLASNTTADAYSYRILVGFCNNINLNVSLLAAGFSGLDLFLTAPSIGQQNGIINPKAFTALYDATFTINSQVSGAADILQVEDTVQINQKFAYEAPNSPLGKSKNLYFIVIPFSVGAPATCGSCAFSTDLIFKNL